MSFVLPLMLPLAPFVLQDASTASLVWLLTQMAEHPDVLERVREEQVGGGCSATVLPLTLYCL